MAVKKKSAYPSRAARSGNPLHRVGLSTPKPKAKPAAKPIRSPRPVPQFTPPPVPTAGGISYGAPALSGGMGGYDIGSDPAVAAAQGLAAKIRAQAQATALAKRKQAAIEYGDPSGVEGIDEATKKAAADNPFSQLKNLEHSYEKGTRDLEEGLNSANLFYSGYRGQQLGEAARDYQNQRYQAGSGFRGLMADINDQLAQALLQADMYEASAMMGSDGGGYDYGGYDEGGGGSDVIRALNPYYGTHGTQVASYGTPTKKPAPAAPRVANTPKVTAARLRAGRM